MLTQAPLRAINEPRRQNVALESAIRDAFDRFVDSGWYVLGGEVERFEKSFASYCGVSYAAGVANGTDALELALRALDIQPGDKVALAANAGGYGSTAVRAIGALPVYVDIDDTHCMGLEYLSKALSDNDIKAAIITHLYGQLAGIEALQAVCREYGVRVIEDCAQAHGARLGSKVAGAWGDLACFSFYPTKNLGALGDAGAVVTNDAELDARVRKLRQYGWRVKYQADLPHGRNSRLDELQAAILSVKLPYLDGWNERRREIARRYAGTINHPLVDLPVSMAEDYVAHLFVVRTAKRAGLAGHLRSSHVPFDIHYPIPDYQQVASSGTDALPHTERACAEVLTLPCFPEMTDDEVNGVAAAVNAWRP